MQILVLVGEAVVQLRVRVRDELRGRHRGKRTSTGANMQARVRHQNPGFWRTVYNMVALIATTNCNTLSTSWTGNYGAQSDFRVTLYGGGEGEVGARSLSALQVRFPT